MVTEMNISQFRSWLNNAPPEDLVTIAPQLFSRIGTLMTVTRIDSSRRCKTIRRPRASSRKLQTVS